MRTGFQISKMKQESWGTTVLLGGVNPFEKLDPLPKLWGKNVKSL